MSTSILVFWMSVITELLLWKIGYIGTVSMVLYFYLTCVTWYIYFYRKEIKVFWLWSTYIDTSSLPRTKYGSYTSEPNLFSLFPGVIQSSSNRIVFESTGTGEYYFYFPLDKFHELPYILTDLKNVGGNQFATSSGV
jgi:hypothetical protein